MNTLTEAKSYLRTHFVQGVKCPCCDQFVKQYKRGISAATAVKLIRLYHMPRGFHDYRKLCRLKEQIGDFPKLRYWGLTELQPKDPDVTETRTSGMWAITAKGIAFVENLITVPKYVLLYDSNLRGFEGAEVGIKETLGTKFNYQELMNR